MIIRFYDDERATWTGLRLSPERVVISVISLSPAYVFFLKPGFICFKTIKTNKAAGFIYFPNTGLNAHWKYPKTATKTALKHVSIVFDTCQFLLLGKEAQISEWGHAQQVVSQLQNV